MSCEQDIHVEIEKGKSCKTERIHEMKDERNYSVFVFVSINNMYTTVPGGTIFFR